MNLLIEVPVFGLDRIRSQENGRLRGTVDVIVQDGLLHLEEKQALRDVLDQLLCDILRVEFGPEFEKQRALFAHVLSCNLQHIVAKSG